MIQHLIYSAEIAIWRAFLLGALFGGVVATFCWCACCLAGRVDRNLESMRGEVGE
jgi:hypothetical protein